MLHPVRLRILQAFLGRDTMTTRELAERLADVPQATLYRHLGTLADGGVLRVVAERRVRGAVERVFALPEGSASLAGADLAHATPEDHLRYFATFLATLQGEFARYLGRGEIDPEADGMGYRTFTVNLSDEEFAEFIAAMNDLIGKAAAKPSTPDRRPRAVARIVIPLDD